MKGLTVAPVAQDQRKVLEHPVGRRGLAVNYPHDDERRAKLIIEEKIERIMHSRSVKRPIWPLMNSKKYKKYHAAGVVRPILCLTTDHADLHLESSHLVLQDSP